MDKLPPKQQVLMLLEQCLATGVKGRIAEIIKHAKAEIDSRDNFTDQFYANAVSDVSDPKFPGLVFKVGKRSRRWIFRYTPKGHKSTKQQTLGYFPEMSVSEARQAWHELSQPKAEVQEANLVAYSVTQLVADYVGYAKKYRTDWRREQRFLERYFDDLYGSLPADSITEEHVLDVINGAEQRAISQGGHGQRAKEKACSILRHLYDVARGKTECDLASLPWLDPQLANPTETIQITRTTVKQMPLFASDVGRYAKALAGLPIHQDLQALLQLQLVTLAPLSILCRLEWTQIDWNNHMIAVDQFGSSREAVLIPLPASAMQLLELRRRKQQQKQLYVFTATKQQHKPMPLRYPSKMLAALREHLQLPTNFTCGRVIRFGNEWLLQSNASFGQVGNLVSKGHFQLIGNKPLVERAEQWSQHLNNLRQTV